MIKKSCKEVKMSDDALMRAMTSLVKVLRELLANMQEEHKAILEQNAFIFPQIMNQRDTLINVMQESRQTMNQELDLLSASHPGLSQLENEKEKLMNLPQFVGEDRVELLTLRDQVLALIEKMENQNTSNNVLLGNGIPDSTIDKEKYNRQYKPIKRRIHPKKNPVPQKKSLIKTLEK